MTANSNVDSQMLSAHDVTAHSDNSEAGIRTFVSHYSHAIEFCNRSAWLSSNFRARRTESPAFPAIVVGASEFSFIDPVICFPNFPSSWSRSDPVAEQDDKY